MTQAVDYALLLGEMEGTYAKLKVLGTAEEIEFVEAMKKKYYKLYFSTLKQEREQLLDWSLFFMGY